MPSLSLRNALPPKSWLVVGVGSAVVRASRPILVTAYRGLGPNRHPLAA